MDSELKPGDSERLGALARMASESGVTSAEYAITWVLSRPAVASVILGWRTEAQMESAIAAAGFQIRAAHLAELDALFPPRGPLTEERVLVWRDGAWALRPVELS